MAYFTRILAFTEQSGSQYKRNTSNFWGSRLSSTMFTNQISSSWCEISLPVFQLSYVVSMQEILSRQNRVTVKRSRGAPISPKARMSGPLLSSSTPPRCGEVSGRAIYLSSRSQCYLNSKP